MPYTQFMADGKACEMDADIQSRLEELQAAVLELQEKAGLDASAMKAALARADARKAQLALQAEEDALLQAEEKEAAATEEER